MSYYCYSNKNVDFSNSYINEKIVNFAHRLDSRNIQFTLELATSMRVATFSYCGNDGNEVRKVFMLNRGENRNNGTVCFPRKIMNRLFPESNANTDSYGNAVFHTVGNFVSVINYGIIKLNAKKLYPCESVYFNGNAFQYGLEPFNNYSDYENARLNGIVRDSITNEFVNKFEIKTRIVDGKYFPISNIPRNIKKCAYSNEWHHVKNMEKIDNKYIAKRYVFSASEICSECGERHLSENMSIFNGNFICKDCMKSKNFKRCEHCGRIIRSTETAFKTNTGYYCNDCIGRINGYHDSHDYERIFKTRRNDNSLFIGFENEFDFCDGSREYRDKVKYFVRDIRLLNDKCFNLERDGSLHNGVEVISEVFSEEYIRHNSYIPAIFKLAEKYGFEKNPRCGLHFHLNKSQLNEKTMENLVVLYTLHFDEFVKIAKRTDVEYCGRPLRYSKSGLSDKKGELIDYMENNSSHYVALNYGNENTIEIRLFSGVVTYKDFMDSFETMIHILNFAKSHSFEECLNSTISGIFENAIPRVKARIRETLNLR